MSEDLDRLTFRLLSIENVTFAFLIVAFALSSNDITMPFFQQTEIKHFEMKSHLHYPISYHAWPK